jgi:predicted RNase H-like HicB family nuclease
MVQGTMLILLHLKGIHAGGDTPEEALYDAREAAGLLLKCKIEDGDPIPLDVIEKPREEDIPVLWIFRSLRAADTVYTEPP